MIWLAWCALPPSPPLHWYNMPSLPPAPSLAQRAWPPRLRLCCYMSTLPPTLLLAQPALLPTRPLASAGSPARAAGVLGHRSQRTALEQVADSGPSIYCCMCPGPGQSPGTCMDTKVKTSLERDLVRSEPRCEINGSSSSANQTKCLQWCPRIFIGLIIYIHFCHSIILHGSSASCTQSSQLQREVTPHGFFSSFFTFLWDAFPTTNSPTHRRYQLTPIYAS